MEFGLWLLFGNIGIACGTTARLLIPALVFLVALPKTRLTWKEFGKKNLRCEVVAFRKSTQKIDLFYLT